MVLPSADHGLRVGQPRHCGRRQRVGLGDGQVWGAIHKHNALVISPFELSKDYSVFESFEDIAA